MISNKKKISFVIPVYNEEDNISFLYDKLKVLCDELSISYECEILFVNDGSRDGSWIIIRQLSQKDNRVRGISFTRNFGHQIALTAGYDYAYGDAVISLDSDMQHPPEHVQKMIAEWEKGFRVVYARRRAIEDSFFKIWSSRIYISFLNSVSGQVFPHGVADFRLLDRSVLYELNKCSERFRYLRGAVASLGYPASFVDYDQPPRKTGVSKYSLYKMLALGFNGLICFSTLPLRLLCYVGFGILVSSAFAIFLILIKRPTPFNVSSAYGLVFFLLYLFIGVIFLMLWIMSEYLIRMYESQKRNTPYVIFETVGSDFYAERKKHE